MMSREYAAYVGTISRLNRIPGAPVRAPHAMHPSVTPPAPRMKKNSSCHQLPWHADSARGGRPGLRHTDDSCRGGGAFTVGAAPPQQAAPTDCAVLARACSTTRPWSVEVLGHAPCVHRAPPRRP